MRIDGINGGIVNSSPGMIQQNFSTGMLKKALNDQESMMALLLKSMPQETGIGQNVDITI